MEYVEVADVGSTKRRIVKRILFFAIAIVLLYPFETDVIQSLQFKVVHAETGFAMGSMIVSEKWANYGSELVEHVDEARTDQMGFVTFPQRSFRSPLLLRAIAPLVNIIRYGRNARWGSQAYITAYISDSEWGFVHVFPDQPVPEQVIVSRSTRK